jgi:hypothetical protein
MNEPVKTLTNQQLSIVQDLTARYGIEAEDIIFFNDEAKPTLTYRGNCALCNQLLNPRDIDIYPITSVSPDSISLKCTIIWDETKTRHGVGVVNRSETSDGKPLTDSQIYELASSRAIRNALKNSDVDLFKLHQQSNGEILEFKVKSSKATLIARVHILAKEALLIQGDNKSAYFLQLYKRYRVNHSSELSEQQLEDFAAFLNSLVPPAPVAA